jgi:serpin B
MIEPGGIWIDEAYHKTFIAVDEKGAEAAAATAIVMRELSATIPDVELTIDRPFFVGIRDVPTNNLLFFGRVLNPTA